MDIREYKEDDQDQVVDLWNRCGLAVSWNDPKKDITRKLMVGRDLFLVCVEKGKIIGSVMGGYEGHRGWINYLAVCPNHQRQGIGRQLMSIIEVKMKKRGCPKINLQVRGTNKSVIAFYKALGYGNDNVVSLGKRLEHDDKL